MAPFYPNRNESIKLPYTNIDTTVKRHPGLGLQRAETSVPTPDFSQLFSGLYPPPIATRVPPPTAHTVGSNDGGMQWDDVLNRVEPPLPNRGLVAPQHSLDLGGLYVSSDSEDDLVDALADSDDGELSSQSIIRELRRTAPARRPQDLANRTSGALPLFERSESFVRGCPIDSGNEVLGNQLQHSATHIGHGNAVQPRDLVRTSAANQAVFSMNSGSAASLVYPIDTAAHAVSFERPAEMDLPLSYERMERLQGVSVQSVQTVRGPPRPVLVAPASLYLTSNAPASSDYLTMVSAGAKQEKETNQAQAISSAVSLTNPPLSPPFRTAARQASGVRFRRHPRSDD